MSRRLSALAVSILWCGIGLSIPPAMQGKDLSTGKPVSWDPKGTSVVVFISPNCPCSRSHEMPLADLAKRYPKVQFLGIVSGPNSQQGAVAHFKNAKLPFPVIEEASHEWADAFGALKTPHAFIVNAGQVAFRGGVDDSRDAERAKKHYLAEALSEVAAGKPVSVADARSVGCAIRR